MVNRLDMDKKQGIHQLLASGMPKRQIARTLGVNRKSIDRELAIISSKGATPSEALTAQALTGSEDSKGAKALTGSGEVQPIVAAEVLAPKEESNLPPGSRSKCAKFHDLIVAKLEQGLTSQRIHQDLVREHGFDDKYHSVRRYVNSLALPKKPRFDAWKSHQAKRCKWTMAWALDAWITKASFERPISFDWS